MHWHFNVVNNSLFSSVRSGHTIDYRNISLVGQEHLYHEDYVVHVLKINIFQQKQSEKKSSPWIGAWKWQKWPQVILSHPLGCDMAHQALARWAGPAWSHPYHLV